jgi:hypothetical protein
MGADQATKDIMGESAIDTATRKTCRLSSLPQSRAQNQPVTLLQALYRTGTSLATQPVEDSDPIYIRD